MLRVTSALTRWVSPDVESQINLMIYSRVTYPPNDPDSIRLPSGNDVYPWAVHRVVLLTEVLLTIRRSDGDPWLYEIYIPKEPKQPYVFRRKDVVTLLGEMA